MLNRFLRFLPSLAAAKPQPTYKQMMALRPQRNPAVHWQRREADGLVEITIAPRAAGAASRGVQWLLGRPREKRIELSDELSSGVWEMCDGRHTLGQIAAFLAQEYKMGHRQAEVSVLAFLKTLQTKKLVGLPADQVRALQTEREPKKSSRAAAQTHPKGGFYAGRKALRGHRDAGKR